MVMTSHQPTPLVLDRVAALEAENRMLREEIRVSREAAEITAMLVVEQFEKTAAILSRLEVAKNHLDEKNAELEQANERLQQLDKLKSDFLSSVSHELRTPLTSIRGFASLIEREFSRTFGTLAENNPDLQKKSRRISDNLGIILKESERLTRLINDVLDLAKIEAGRVEWHDESIRVDKLVLDAVNAAQGIFDTKAGVVLRHNISPQLPMVIGDADRLQQVLVNLLNNAAKFTERGEVVVKAHLNTDGQIQVSVSDTGVGFPSADAEAIFDKFQQSSQGDTLSDKPKGTGLGLAISREIVGRHGGRIWAESEPGKGSVFHLTLPMAAPGLSHTAGLVAQMTRPQDAALPLAASRPAGDRKPLVLVVDDDPGICSYLSQLLTEQGNEVVTASSGEAALSAAQEHQPDLITMDLDMPGMGGKNAIVKLRDDPILRQIPVMVVSAIPGWETAGGDLAMCKPIDEGRLLENINLLLGRRVAAPSPSSTRFLVLHEAGLAQALAPSSFWASCEISFCPLENLEKRIREGFQGMVVVPANLIDRIDLPMLQETQSLEVIIMPVQATTSTCPPSPHPAKSRIAP